MLGDRVQARRKELGLTQERLAADSGLKQFHISRIESGDIKDIKGETLRRLARALRCTTDYLVGMYEEEDDPAPAFLAGVG
jgi:transcriptional regulator with XRE-family HTH domain